MKNVVKCMVCLFMCQYFFVFSQSPADPIIMINVDPFDAQNCVFLSGDLDGDHLIDFVRGSPDPTIYFNRGKNGFNQLTLDVPDIIRMYAVLDMDNDGRADLLNDQGIMQNNGSKTFVQKELGSLSIIGTFRTTSFLNADDLPELICVESSTTYPDRLVVYFNKGSFIFDQIIVDTVQHIFGLINTGDFKGNGDSDIIVISDQNGQDVFVIYENVGSQKFEKRLFAVQESMNGRFIGLEDIDGDGDGDVLFSTNDQRVVVYINHAEAFDRSFEDIELDIYCARLGDLDSDGDQDIVSLVRSEHGMFSFGCVLNNGNGTFQPYLKIVDIVDPDIRFFQNQKLIQFGDIDGDRREDLILQSPGEGIVYGVKWLDHPTHIPSQSITEVSVYPNPSTAYLKFEHDAQFAPEIWIIDRNGRVIENVELSSLNIDISNLSSGTFFLCWQFGSGDWGFEKFVKR